MHRVILLLLLALLSSRSFAQTSPAQAKSPGEVSVGYQLPTTGPLPATYRVTLAIVDPKNPDWIISQFACGVPRTVTAENGGRFTETWDGLDDNFMPVPPGDYAVKGIYMPARQWEVDGEWHSITPRFHSGASSWMPSQENARRPIPFGGDPVGAPFEDIAVGQNGVAVFYYGYLENGLNNPMFDLRKPVGIEQFIQAFPSGGAGGGSCVATDGETVWAFSTDGGPKYVYRADGKPFGSSPGANRSNSYPPAGWVTAMAAWRDGATTKPVVFCAQRGKIVEKGRRQFTESDTEFADKVTALSGADGHVLGELPLQRPQGLAVRGNLLFALHRAPDGFAVSSVALKDGVPVGSWQPVFTVPRTISPADLEVDSHGRFYLSDSAANKVFQLDAAGTVLRAFGLLAAQVPGAYYRETLMSPGKLATWTDQDGNDRLLIVEKAGPNRASEWSADGKLLREFMSLQTKANDGYTIDPEHPEHVYLPGQQGWLTRFRVDYEARTWAVDAVWPDIGADPLAPELKKPVLLRTQGHMYLAGSSGGREGAYPIYRLDGERWKLSAAILRRSAADPKGKPTVGLWHDANNNGRVDEEEISPSNAPAGLFVYHGHNWSEDFSFLAMEHDGRDIWRLAPAGFDSHGNPVFRDWQKVVTDPVFVARAEGKADAVHGGNEVTEKFNSDWFQTDGNPSDGFWVQARGGKNFSANEGAQFKISRYVSDPQGGFRLRWRTGRAALQGLAKPGEIYGGMRIRRPINGLVSVIDQSRCGVLLYNEDGLYVDTLFPDGRRFTPKTAGLYSQPGEFFAGIVYPNAANGKIYIGTGKYTPLLFEAEGWSLRENPAKPLTGLPKTVSITASQIASAPEIALSLRGGAGIAKVAPFAPALGEVAFDGSMAGWESVEPVKFQADKEQTVEVRCLYRPESLLLRWHARLPRKVDPKPLPPLPRVFTHDQLADTLSFYVQGDANAKPGSADGRPGDVRFVFGLFKDKAGKVQPTVVGFYPEWRGAGTGTPQVYRTPVGQVSFAHVGTIPGAKLAHVLDEDGKGFVLLAELPRTAIPQIVQPFSGAFRTLVNFEATFGGHNKFWWANSDGSASRETYDEPSEARLYPGSWAPAEFAGLEQGIVVRHWLVCGPFGGPGAAAFKADPSGAMPGTKKDWKQAAREFCEAASYPPDSGSVNPGAVYSGDLISGYWPPLREVRWKRETIADLDTRVTLGASAQTWYGATWVHVPVATELEFQFQGHPMTYYRWFLNGQPIPIKPSDFKEGSATNRPIAASSVSLQPGWNEVRFRTYGVGYPPARAGLVLKGSPEKLWNVQVTATPPSP